MKTLRIKTTFALMICLLFISSTYAQSAPETFKNPILSGFYPDPSICRVGDTYYMVNSSFEWYPGLPIHRSKDLVNWEKIGHGLHRPDQIVYQDGLKNSNGIFAPSIRYYKGTFYIITTMVGQKGNFIITAKNPSGPWSDPMWIKDAPGIDPSLFWDDDGRCYYTGAGVIDGTQKDWPGKNGVWMQEIDPDKGILIGDKKQLTYGHASNARWAEGPHLFKIDGEYILLIGEGGTSEFHAVTIFNSKNLWGPYVPNHANPIMTHRHLGYTYPIIQTGHADLVQTQNGEWWSVMLAKRPIDGYSILARETFLAKIEVTRQESGVTLIYNPGKGLLQTEQKRPDLTWTPVPELNSKDNFDSETISLEWNCLRTPQIKWYRQAKGKMEIDLRPQTISEWKNPSFLAKRVKHHDYEVSTKMHFSSKKENEQAGLVLYRKSSTHYQLLRIKNEMVLLKTTAKEVNAEKGMLEEIARMPFKGKEVHLKLVSKGLKASFYFGSSEADLLQIGEAQDLSHFGDEIAWGFNGTYIGMYATSLGEKSKNKAYFDWFEYKNQH
ncbi:glycoside hydrolase family 43 protein [Labilibaculum sp. DW002]|uniref:Glycoside hydrolase family 43 protein n=1 Tax=Paralabilibaculum antarcticum TaxID=2912572 RepID=A0ABT5VVV6_9BACT|nr:glycoside hydrolase family 43 protein [Labilibaculum sp. DW002]MDE5419558.1 glycoside hydrolase family 43 protein [Labilibaculum sp. DW002]